MDNVQSSQPEQKIVSPAILASLNIDAQLPVCARHVCALKRVFSTAGDIVNKKRAALEPDQDLCF